jgi:hypothetical protein
MIICDADPTCRADQERKCRDQQGEFTRSPNCDPSKLDTQSWAIMMSTPEDEQQRVCESIRDMNAYIK